MSFASKTKLFYRIAVNPQYFFLNTRYIFILSHMRSRSSVLSHVLGSNPEICGYGELHISYRNRFALIKMRAMLHGELKCELDGKYLLDKMLHNRKLSSRVMETARPKIIFLLREPESTVKSIIRMGGVDWYKDTEKAVEYYCSRLLRLEEYSEKFGKGSIFIDSGHLVDNTDRTLQKLSEWLGLGIPLRREYIIFPGTGKPGMGDPSDNIRSGIIEKTKENDDIYIPSALLQKGEACYARCRAALLQNVI